MVSLQNTLIHLFQDDVILGPQTYFTVPFRPPMSSHFASQKHYECDNDERDSEGHNCLGKQGIRGKL